MLSTSRTLLRGVPTLVGEAIAVGTANVRSFSVQKVPGPDANVTFQCINAFTTLSGNVEASSDGGTTWSVFAAFDFAANPVKVLNLAAGIIYRFNIAILTGGNPNILATLS